MKVLYAIQGTGNGHISRAQEFISILQRKVELDLLVSGEQVDLKLPYEIKYRLKGFGFFFGKNGGIDIWKTLRKTNFRNFWKQVQALPMHEYDLVINDFEPISAWAAKRAGVRCIGLSHQAAVLGENAPKPRGFHPIGKFILNHYAPSNETLGFHFEKYNPSIFYPIIKKEIRGQKIRNLGHYTVYLPSFSHRYLVDYFKQFPQTQWEVFAKTTKTAYVDGNVRVHPIDGQTFIRSMCGSGGVICGAGFETPSEALFLNKKLLVIPMYNQYEQLCNAAALKDMGVSVLKGLGSNEIERINDWIRFGPEISRFYPDESEEIIAHALKEKITDNKKEFIKLIYGTVEKVGDRA